MSDNIIIRIFRYFIRHIALFLVNSIFDGTRPCFFNLKRWLLNQCGFRIGHGTKVVGPIACSATLTIGQNCWIGTGFTVRGNGEVILGDNIDVGPDVTFLTGSHQIGNASRRAGNGYNGKTIIGSGSWIGGRVTILSNIRVGDACIIAAGAVVCKDSVENVIIGGVPAKVIKVLNT